MTDAVSTAEVVNTIVRIAITGGALVTLFIGLAFALLRGKEALVAGGNVGDWRFEFKTHAPGVVYLLVAALLFATASLFPSERQEKRVMTSMTDTTEPMVAETPLSVPGAPSPVAGIGATPSAPPVQSVSPSPQPKTDGAGMRRTIQTITEMRELQARNVSGFDYTREAINGFLDTAAKAIDREEQLCRSAQADAELCRGERLAASAGFVVELRNRLQAAR